MRRKEIDEAASDEAATDEEALPVLVEPKPGHDDQEVVEVLEREGAERVQVLAPGFISGRAPGAARKAVAEIASVHVKVRKQLRDEPGAGEEE